MKALKGSIIFPSNINIDIRDIYLSSNVIMIKLHFRPFSSQKDKTHVL